VPYLPTADREAARTRRSGRKEALPTLSGLILFALAIAGTLHFMQTGQVDIQAERDLIGVSSELHAQDALEWRAISGRSSPEQARNELVQSRARSTGEIKKAGREGLPRPAVDRLLALQQSYGEAVAAQLRGLGADPATSVPKAGLPGVDPDLSQVQTALSEYQADMLARADRANRLSNLGHLLIIGLAGPLIFLVRRWLGRGDRRRKQERLSESRYRTLVDQSADIVMVADRDGIVQYLSPEAERLLGHDLQLATTTNDLLVQVHPEDRSLLTEALAGADPEPVTARFELRVSGHPVPASALAKVGELDDLIWRIFEVAVQDLCGDPAVRGFVLTGHDITDRHALQQELEHRALHDALTGLPNRALLADRLDQALQAGERQGTKAGLLLIDLDRFKEINDTLGHHYGDELLTLVGPRLAGALRGVDTVARLGGDEFAVLLPVVNGVVAAVEVANKLQLALSRPFRVEGVDLDVEASIGIVVAGEHGNDTSTLMQRADIAMYAAKQRSLGISIYRADADSHTPERLALLGDLRRALNHDELFLHYQPKVSLRTGEVCGAEALLRWQHPERGLTSPDDFIPLAENTGLVGPLTTHVLNLALEQARRWIDQNAALQIAVNLSARNLLDEELDETVAELLAWYGVDAALLKLEITESAVMTDPTRAAEVLERLSAQGIAISIDDFGAGYTSIRQLRNLPIAELKVDKSFVSGMEHDPGNSTIVRSVIELGHNLGMTAVAEGIENVETLKCLIAYDCDVAQGYFLSRPLLAVDFDRWRANWAGLPELSGRPQSSGRPVPPPGAGGVPEPRGVIVRP